MPYKLNQIKLSIPHNHPTWNSETPTNPNATEIQKRECNQSVIWIRDVFICSVYGFSMLFRSTSNWMNFFVYVSLFRLDIGAYAIAFFGFVLRLSCGSPSRCCTLHYLRTRSRWLLRRASDMSINNMYYLLKVLTRSLNGKWKDDSGDTLLMIFVCRDVCVHLSLSTAKSKPGNFHMQIRALVET